MAARTVEFRSSPSHPRPTLCADAAGRAVLCVSCFYHQGSMTGKMDSIVTQMNIRNNVREMQESVKDLYSWEDEMKRKEEDLKKRSSSSKAATRAPRVRGKAAPVTAPGDSSLHAPSPSLTPGATPETPCSRPLKRVRSVAHPTGVGDAACIHVAVHRHACMLQMPQHVAGIVQRA